MVSLDKHRYACGLSLNWKAHLWSWETGSSTSKMACCLLTLRITCRREQDDVEAKSISFFRTILRSPNIISFEQSRRNVLLLYRDYRGELLDFRHVFQFLLKHKFILTRLRVDNHASSSVRLHVMVLWENANLCTLTRSQRQQRCAVTTFTIPAGCVSMLLFAKYSWGWWKCKSCRYLVIKRSRQI